MKQCSKCKENKDLLEFCKRTSSKDGYGILCKSCRVLINSLNKENRQKWWKQYYAKKKKVICAQRIVKRIENPEKIKEIKQKSYLKNKDKIKIKNKEKKLKKQIKPIENTRNRSLSLSEYLNN